MSTQTPCPKDDPRMIAWEDYKTSSEYANNLHWAKTGSDYVEGSLWATFVAGFEAVVGKGVKVQYLDGKITAWRDCSQCKGTGTTSMGLPGLDYISATEDCGACDGDGGTWGCPLGCEI